MNLGNDKWQNTQGKLGSSSTGRGEAPETRGRELESLLATTEYESPTDTVVVRAVLGSQLSRTAVYGPVRTVVWQGSAGDRRPYADLKNRTNDFSHRRHTKSISGFTRVTRHDLLRQRRWGSVARARHRCGKGSPGSPDGP